MDEENNDTKKLTLEAEFDDNPTKLAGDVDKSTVRTKLSVVGNFGYSKLKDEDSELHLPHDDSTPSTHPIAPAVDFQCKPVQGKFFLVPCIPS